MSEQTLAGSLTKPTSHPPRPVQAGVRRGFLRCRAGNEPPNRMTLILDFPVALLNLIERL